MSRGPMAHDVAQGATLKRGSPYPQLKGPHRSVGVHHPNSRGLQRGGENCELVILNSTIGSMDGAYKGHLHVTWPFIGRKTLTKGKKEYNDFHGFYRARTQEDNDDEDVVGDDGDACALSCTKSHPEKMSMCNKCELQYCTDCIDTHKHTHVTM